ncbi:MAG: STAS domain-containing protein [Oscillospiraceae bacterium]|nr:STAS domain-containing protein [Oscillospiraceae bacterium]
MNKDQDIGAIMNDIFSDGDTKLDYSVDNGVITIFLPERVESTNADKLQKSIDKCIAASGCDDVIFDSTATKYVSSAGLRVFMRVYKAHNSVKFVNLTEEVTEIFDITGFIDIFL